MRKTTILQRVIKILGVSAITILFFACPEPFTIKEIQIEGQQDKAAVFFYVTDDISMRTVLPQVSLTNAASYKLLGGISGEAETVLVNSFTGTGTSLALDPGTWNFTLNAYNSAGAHILQGKVQDRQINLTGTNQISFSMSALNEGTGKIQITLKFPTTAEVTKISVNGDVASENFTSFTNGTFVYTKNEVTAGDYFVNFELYRGTALHTVVSELVVVRSNLTSSKTITLQGQDLKPLLTGTVSITGIVVVGEILTANTTALNGTGAISYQWKRGTDNIADSNANTYTVQAADVGKTITVTVTRNNYLGEITSSPTAAVPAFVSTTLNTVTQDGDSKQTTTLLTLTFSSAITNLTANDITLTHSVSDQSFVKGVPTASGSTYTLPISGFVMDGTVTVAVAKPGYIISGSPKTVDIYFYSLTLSGKVSISGTFSTGQTLTAVTTNLSGNGALTYQWNRDGTAISGATNSTYTVVSADIGKNITVRVTRAGYSGYIDSPAVLPALTGTVSITGTAKVGQTLTANTASIGGSGDISYQWKRNGTAISGATGSTYTLQSSDLNATFTVTVTRAGYSGGITSSETATITNPTLTGSVIITGNVQVGQTLTANTSSLDGSGTIFYQWKKGDIAISGATGSTYVIQAADLNNTIKVTVTRSGNSGSITSAPVSVFAILPFSTTVEGFITTASNTNRFSIVLAKAGTITLSLTSPIGTGALPNKGADVKWYNSDGTSVSSSGTTAGFNFTYTENISLAIGTYFIDIVGRSGAGNTGKYNIRVDYYNDEVEPNNTIATAQQLISSLTVNGSISSSSDTDFYKYVLAEPGKLTINADLGSSSSSGLYYAYVRWYNADGTQIRSSDPLSSYNDYMDLEKGTYYIEITPHYSSYSGVYSLRGDFTAAGNNETEPNNERVTAQLLTSGQTVKGFISYQDNTDIYKCVLTAAGRLTINADLGSSSSSGLYHAYVKWYNADGTQIGSSPYYTTCSAYMDLGAGTYYIEVSPFSSSNTGTYNLKVTW